MALDTPTIIMIGLFGLFVYKLLWLRKAVIPRLTASIGFLIVFGALLMNASESSHYAVATIGILMSIGLSLVALTTPNSGVRAGGILKR